MINLREARVNRPDWVHAWTTHFARIDNLDNILTMYIIHDACVYQPKGLNAFSHGHSWRRGFCNYQATENYERCSDYIFVNSFQWPNIWNCWFNWLQFIEKGVILLIDPIYNCLSLCKVEARWPSTRLILSTLISLTHPYFLMCLQWVCFWVCCTSSSSHSRFPSP